MQKISCTGNKFTWSRDTTKILIELYEGYPCLYQVTSEEYYNKNKRTAAVEAITTEFNKRNLTTLSTKVIQDKIHGLRTQFLAEVNKCKKSKVSGSGADDVYKPKLWCFDILQFISKGTLVTKGESNLETLPKPSTSHEVIQESAEEELMCEPEIVYDGDIEGVESLIMSPSVISEEETSTGTPTPRSRSRLVENPSKRKRTERKENLRKLKL